MEEPYQWIKALHLISVIAWMAGLLYLPRLFVYHCDAERGSDKSETFKVMERRLLRAIMNPAMVLTWIFGLLMLYMSEAWTEKWMMVKLVLVA
ncbi:MAG: CopD family protein, partial [Alphaproteobacteria bacterium]|nr:CopD family protein [Alphaproteobacteria bacterium]